MLAILLHCFLMFKYYLFYNYFIYILNNIYLVKTKQNIKLI